MILLGGERTEDIKTSFGISNDLIIVTLPQMDSPLDDHIVTYIHTYVY